MAESKLRELSVEFSVDIIELVKHLKSMKESVIYNQIGRSSTSIGANIHEAQYAQGKRYFISELEIALKKQVKRVIDSNSYTEQNMSMSKHSNENPFTTVGGFFVCIIHSSTFIIHYSLKRTDFRMNNEAAKLMNN